MTSTTLIRTTCPRDCYDACGVVALVRDGALTAVRGDPDHHVSKGRLCRKCSIAYNGVLRDPQARLASPLRRVGAKGEARFVEVSWESALAEIADRLGAVSDQVGSSAILNAHYTGTCALLGGGFGQRLMRAINAREVDPDTICNQAGYDGLGYVYGDGQDGFDPESARDAACIMVWGANPSVTAPHQHEHWLANAPGRVIVIDPIRTETAAAADLHLQPFPGSDAALAFALMHVMRDQGLIDHSFLARRTAGYEELEPFLDEASPTWAETVTGVPEALIREAAIVYGRGPSMLWLGQGFQRQARGGNAARSVALLPVLSGNLDRPGTGWAYVTGHGSRKIDDAYLTGSGLGSSPPAPLSQMRLADELADPAASGAIVCWNINIAASNPRQEETRRALARDDLLVVVLDLFMTDTARYADYVLPATSFLESDDLVCSYFHHTLSAQVRVTDPPGMALPNSEIFRRLARAMGRREPELFESDRVVIDELLARTGFGIGFDELAQAGTVRLYDKPRLQELPATITIASPVAERDGHGRLPAPWHDPRPPDGYLRLLSPASPWALNTSFVNDGKVARKFGPPTVVLHPVDAAAKQLSDGQTVLIANTAGRLEARLRIDTIAPVGVAYSPKGHWGVNINAVNPGVMSDMGQSTAVHGVEVQITAV